MARVFVDVNLFSTDWFRTILEADLVPNKAVRFVYSDDSITSKEHEKAKKAATFYKLMGMQGRRDDVGKADCEKHQTILQSLSEWQDEGACDDPHIFSMVYNKPTGYVFSSDTRIAKCRDCIRKVVENRYCDFIVIAKGTTYLEHRHDITR